MKSGKAGSKFHFLKKILNFVAYAASIQHTHSFYSNPQATRVDGAATHFRLLVFPFPSLFFSVRDPRVASTEMILFLFSRS
jgi:hypothetical protein